jgi:hypothetical protein
MSTANRLEARMAPSLFGFVRDIWDESGGATIITWQEL